MKAPKCRRCGRSVRQPTGAINRALRIGAPLFCGKVCFGLSRRKNKSIEQKRREKALYDAQYRKKNRAMLKEKKAAYNKRTYDPVKAATLRKANMARHVEYCRSPEYKAWKSEYDKLRRQMNEHARYGLPQCAPASLVESIKLMRALKKEIRREHGRT